MPKLSIVIPFHWMENWQFFMNRCLASIESQTFTDYEIILTKAGSMPVNSNRAIEAAKGELIKILYLDDYLSHPSVLQNIVDNFGSEDHWQVTGCLHQRIGEEPHSPHIPEYTQDIITGNNRIGSPSVLTFRKEGCLYFDENMTWLLDADLYKRYYDKYGPPKIIPYPRIVIGIGDHQVSAQLTEEEKLKEVNYLKLKV